MSIPNRLIIEVIFKTAKQSAKIPQASAPEDLVTRRRKTYPKKEPIIFNKNADVDFDIISLFLYLFIKRLKNLLFYATKI